MVWKKKIFFFLYFHIREVLSHSWEGGSLAAFLGGSQIIREGSHVWVYDIKAGRCSQLKWGHDALWVPNSLTWSNSIRFNIFKHLFLNNHWFWTYPQHSDEQYRTNGPLVLNYSINFKFGLAQLWLLYLTYICTVFYIGLLPNSTFLYHHQFATSILAESPVTKGYICMEFIFFQQRSWQKKWGWKVELFLFLLVTYFRQWAKITSFPKMRIQHQNVLTKYALCNSKNLADFVQLVPKKWLWTNVTDILIEWLSIAWNIKLHCPAIIKIWF